MKKQHIQTLLLVMMVSVLLTLFGCKLTPPAEDTGTPSTGSTYDANGLWAGSGHADETAEAFRHWDEDDPPLVSAGCAKCHSANGFLDWLDNGVVDDAAEPAVIGCEVCHDGGATRDLESVTFPSGVTVNGIGSENICMQCHQGRQAGSSVDSYLATRSAAGADGVNSSIGFRNIHYFVAGAMRYGTVVNGGYEYAGNTYDAYFFHTEGYQSCSDCHDPHSLEVKAEECGKCHHAAAASNSASVQSGGLHDIRSKGSMVDYDGDGNFSEGIYYEIQSFQMHLYNAMKIYSKNIAGAMFGYESHSYPYFFYDKNENGVIDPSEANYGNRYRSWTPRLLKAAYNYQVSRKDPGAFAHGGKYLIQLLYDSLTDLKTVMPNFPMPNLTRGDEGHFDGSTEAWRHWDGDGAVRASCAKCHSATGLAVYLEHGEIEEDQPPANGMTCGTCHTSIPDLHENREVTFPSGAVLSMPGDGSTLCMECHQGRSARKTVNDKTGASTGPYSFTNIHYFPAAAVLFGNEAQGGYEYARKTYAGRQMFMSHGDQFDTCVECHMGSKGLHYNLKHNLARVNPADCVECHGRDVSQPYRGHDSTKFSFDHIRPKTAPDYDGDGDMTESLKAEIQGLEAALYAQLQCYAFGINKPIIYDSHAYPYFFNDKNGNGLSDPGEAIYPNAYRFDGKLLRAAYNYQMSRKEPHGFIHNSMYVAQLLVDSIGDLGGNVAPYTWR